MASPWTIKDLVDFEYYLYRDDGVSGEDLAQRDRAFYLGLEEVPAERSELFHHWLTFRRNAGDGADATPGEAFGECLAILKRAVPVAGLLSGAGLTLTLLQYHGKVAVNVSNYIGTLVVLQIFLLVLLLVATLYRKKVTGRGLQASYPLLSRLVYDWATRISDKAGRHIGGGDRSKLTATLGELKIKKAIYGRVMYQPVFQLVQTFGVLFNVGALGATLLRLLTGDIAFGWQSNLLTSGAMHAMARTLATPWRLVLGEGRGFPSLEQVEGSRMVLKDGMVDLAHADLISWWPFLCLCLVCYGLLPRLALWLFAVIRCRQNLTRLNFTHATCDRLYRRMHTPTLESSAATPNLNRQKIRAAESDAPSDYQPPFAGARGETTLLLVPAELVGEFDGDQMTKIVQQSVGRTVSRTRPYNLGRQGFGELGIQPKESVTIFQEAWQPPIQEYLSFVKRLREHVAPDTAIVILLNGRTRPDEAFAPVGETDRHTWTQVLKSLADPYLGIAEVMTS